MYCKVIFCLTVFLALAGTDVVLLRQQFLNDTTNLECVLKGDSAWSAAAWTTDKARNYKETIPYKSLRFEYDSSKKIKKRMDDLIPLKNCKSGTKISPLCPVNYGWNWTKISETQQNLGPTLDYRWEGFYEWTLLKSNYSYNMTNNYWHASLLAQPGLSILIAIEQMSQTFQIILDTGNITSRISTMYICKNSACTEKIPLKHYKQDAVLNERKWTHISIEINSVPNSGTDLIFLRNRTEILKHNIKDLQLSSAVGSKRATITLNSDYSRLRIHDYYVIHTNTESASFTLVNISAGCWQFLYYGDIGLSYLYFGNVSVKSGSTIFQQEEYLGWRMKDATFTETANITLQPKSSAKWTKKFWAFGDMRKCEEKAWHVSMIESVKTSNAKTITCTALLTGTEIRAAADPDPIAKTTPKPPTTSASSKPQSNDCSDKGLWFWMAVVSLCILIFGLLVALFVIMVWNHGYPWKRREEPFYRRRASFLSGRAPVAAPTIIEMRRNNNNQQQRTYDPAPDRGRGDKQGLVFSNSERDTVTSEPSSSGMLTVPRSRAPPIPTDAQNLAPLPQRSRAMSPMNSTSRHVPLKYNKKTAPLPDETRWKPSTSKASDNAAFQLENGNVRTNTKMERKRVMPLPPIEPPEYGNFNMTVVDEPIFGKDGPIPVNLDPIYGNFGESESSHDPIYGNF